MPSVYRDPRSLWERLALLQRKRAPSSSRRAWLTVGLLLACGAALALAIFLPGGRAAFQPAPVSAVHTLIQNDCNSCHNETFQSVHRLWPSNSDSHSVSDSACLRCHDPGSHHASAQQPDCAVCHREHRGQASLTRVPDRHCLACHADLKGHGARSAAFGKVTGFPEGHPPFERRSDPSQLHFSHAAHLSVAGILGADGKVLHLDCSACHRLDDEGRYLRPVTYAAHCATCHPLAVQLAGNSDDSAVSAALRFFARDAAPHRPPTEIRATLRDRLLSLQHDYPLVAKEDPDPPFRAGAVTLPEFSATHWQRADRDLTDTERRQFVERQLAHLETQLFDRSGGCTYCHVPTSGKVPQREKALPVYESTRLLSRWQPNAVFRHTAHRQVTCGECHLAGRSATVDMRIPELDTCARCHTPRAGARSDCVECHNYHHGSREFGSLFKAEGP